MMLLSIDAHIYQQSSDLLQDKEEIPIGGSILPCPNLVHLIFEFVNKF